MDTVSIFYTKIKSLNQFDLNYIVEQLGDSDKLKLKNLKGKRTIQFLTGRTLLKKGIEILGLDNKLHELEFTDNTKPFFKNNISFSISHSNEIVCCALTNNRIQLGIDVEYHQARKINISSRFFTDKEMGEIQMNEILIYDFWTKKESIVKACSANVFHMNKIECLEKTINYKNHIWFPYRLNLSQGYTTSLVADKHILIKQILVD